MSGLAVIVAGLIVTAALLTVIGLVFLMKGRRR